MPETPSRISAGQALLGQAVVAHERPEIMAGLFGFRRDGVEHKAVDALRAVAFRRAGAGGRDADVDIDGARRLEADDLPAIDRAFLLQLLGPERRRLDALHPPRHRHGLLAMGDVERRFRHRFIADGGAVHKGLVRQIHQIVDDEAVVALHMDGLAVAGPGRIVIPVHVRHQRRIGERGIAHPEPDEAMALDHGIGAHAGRRIDGLLRGHEGAAALRIVFQAVIAADDGVALEPALRQRHQPVPAGVFQRRDLPVGLPVHHDMLAADRARQQRRA